MTDRERWAFVIGLLAGALIATVGWWLQFLMIGAVAGA